MNKNSPIINNSTIFNKNLTTIKNPFQKTTLNNYNKLMRKKEYLLQKT
jgi:hypothetical protein